MFRRTQSSSIVPYSLERNLSRDWYVTELNYSPLMKLGFRMLKGFFLFSAGFCVVYIFSASLNASAVAARLIELAVIGFVPLVAFTFSVIAIVVLLESLR